MDISRNSAKLSDPSSPLLLAFLLLARVLAINRLLPANRLAASFFFANCLVASFLTARLLDSSFFFANLLVGNFLAQQLPLQSQNTVTTIPQKNCLGYNFSQKTRGRGQRYYPPQVP